MNITETKLMNTIKRLESYGLSVTRVGKRKKSLLVISSTGLGYYTPSYILTKP